jgi:4-hydroxy-3-methylbut-2-enyl diphosphate reductase
MEIKLVKSAGFCFGVKRAIDIAIETAENMKGKKIYTIGHIIHNNDVVNYLEKKEIYAINSAQAKNIKESVVILRSHGVEKEILDTIKRNNNHIIDAICPFVKKIHQYVDMLTRENYFVIIVGDDGHPEVKAIYSFANKDMSIVVSSEENKKLNDFLKKPMKKIGVVAQTTQDYENFYKICKKLLNIKGEVRIFNSICNATSKRQKESIDIAKKSDIMIIVGGKHSANTNRLKEICEKIQPNSFHIENEKDLDIKWLKGKNIIGITAGASTPSIVINRVVNLIKSFNAGL